MGERWVVNASPVIALGTIGRLALLTDLADGVVLPDMVAAEIESAQDAAAHAAATFPARRVEVHADPVVLSWGLGSGETAVLSFAKQNPGFVAVLDDLAARRCATALGVRARGTGGVVLLAKSRGIIPSAGPILNALHGAGFYLSPQLVRYALALAGEGTEG